MADNLEPIEPASPAADMEVVGRTSRRGGVAVQGVHTGDGNGVVGEAREGITAGVLGIHTGPKGAGVAGHGFGNAVGVQGNAGTNGVLGEGAIGVRGVSSTDGSAAVFGDHSGAGFGVVGDAAQGNTAGVLGRHKGTFEGHGVRGEGPIGVFGKGTPGVDGICPASGGESGTPSGSLAGVRGNAQSGPGVFGAGGYGGQFTGTKAQLHLVPGTSLGRPTTNFHEKGEMFIDVAGTLFVCVAGGNPGTWRRVMTEPA